MAITHMIAHTIEIYSRYYPYPYPTSLSVNGSRRWNGIPNDHLQWSAARRGRHLSRTHKIPTDRVVIHEVGHTVFMIINSDERNGTWMDEGPTTFAIHCRSRMVKDPSAAAGIRQHRPATSEKHADHDKFGVNPPVWKQRRSRPAVAVFLKGKIEEFAAEYRFGAHSVPHMVKA